MNDSAFGLTASVWTRDEEAALRMGERVETGTWFMNRCDYLDPALAWTGVKDSGRGCALSARLRPPDPTEELPFAAGGIGAKSSGRSSHTETASKPPQPPTATRLWSRNPP